MTIRKGLIDSIGKTPLLELRYLSAETGCRILGKAEFMNPGGSVKDRAALSILKNALAHGHIKTGGLVVEGTAGNTGIGITLVAHALGLRSLIVMPETQSQEKINLLRALGADLRLVPAVPYRDPNNYVRYSGRLAEELTATEPNGVYWANQFDNIANRQAHTETTGPEIWNDTAGELDAFICAVGSGGTLAGVAEALRSRNASIRIGLADPKGAALFNYYTIGEMKSEGSSITEGIGQGRITANLEGFRPDDCFQIGDDEMLATLEILVTKEGLFPGGSSALNVAGAVRYARKLGPGHTIVTVLCDSGERYISKLYNPEFLRAKGLPVPRWLDV